MLSMLPAAEAMLGEVESEGDDSELVVSAAAAAQAAAADVNEASSDWVTRTKDGKSRGSDAGG